MASPQPGEWNVALLGAATLKGKEVKEVLRDCSLPLRRLLLVDAAEAEGQLTEFDDEPAIVQSVAEDTFEGIDLAIFASAAAFTQQHWRQARQSGCRIIDMSYATEDDAAVQLSAPLVEPLLAPPSGEAARQATLNRLAVSAHPMAMALAGILSLLHRCARIVRAAATVFEPASERGQAGVEELHRQTVSLLSFQEVPKKVFDAQLSFNLLARNGGQAVPPLREGQERIASHLRRILGKDVPPPAIRLLQAPVFHGYSFACWVELEHPVELAEIETALDRPPFVLSRPDEEPPNAVSAAGSDNILLGAIERDPAHAAGFWIWGAFDNLRIASLNAERIAERMMGLSQEPASNCRPGQSPVVS